MKHTIRLFAVLMGIFLTSFAVPALAQAEQCSPDGKICLVTDVGQSIQTPGPIRLLLPSEATQGATIQGYTTATSQQLITQGPPGGKSLWEVSLAPVSSDVLGSLKVLTREYHPEGPGPILEATFQVQLLSPVANLHAQIVRQGKRFVAEVSYDGRTTVQNVVHLMLGTNPDVTGYYPKYKQKLVTRPAGPQVIRIGIGRSTVKRLCQRYPYCKLLVRLQQSVPYYDEQGSQRYFQIAPDPVLNYGTRIVKNKHTHRK